MGGWLRVAAEGEPSPAVSLSLAMKNTHNGHEDAKTEHNAAPLSLPGMLIYSIFAVFLVSVLNLFSDTRSNRQLLPRNPLPPRCPPFPLAVSLTRDVAPKALVSSPGRPRYRRRPDSAQHLDLATVTDHNV